MIVTRIVSCALLMASACAVQAEEALIAVATNFVPAATRLATEFETISEHRIRVAGGSTGKLYAQIINGAPYDAFLAADQQRPKLLESAGRSVAGSRFTYAVGQLVLGSVSRDRIGKDLRESISEAHRDAATVALANPALAPYGAASRQVLVALQLWAEIADNIVMGENIAQTHALVATANADLGFLARSSVTAQSSAINMIFVAVPDHLHEPIRQDAVLLSHGAKNNAAQAFLVFLRTDRTRGMLRDFGYETD